MKKLLIALLVALVIPTIGFAVAFFILRDISQSLPEPFPKDIIEVCQLLQSEPLQKLATADTRAACQEVGHIDLLKKTSVIAAAIGVVIPILYWLASLLAGTSRRRIATIFPKVLRLSVLLLAVTTLLQGAILTYAVYIGESYSTGSVHFVLIGAIGLGALAASFKLIVASMSFGKKLRIPVIGKVLTSTNAPTLFQFVESLAKKLSAKMPDNIIVGLEPTFYVTSCEIVVPNEQAIKKESLDELPLWRSLAKESLDEPAPLWRTLKGESLYVSAPLLRLLSRDEFASVVGHELGHFKGEDTVYSMRFAPIYAGLGAALEAILPDEEEASALAKLPALVMLGCMYAIFSTNEATISRDREHKADTAGAEAGSPLALSTALIKLSMYSSFWDHACKQYDDRSAEGAISNNLSKVFEDTVKFGVEHAKIEEILQSTLEQSISHPTDSHPPILKRLKELAINPAQISREMLLVPEDAAIRLLERREAIEKAITTLRNTFIIGTFYITPQRPT